jgi:DNA-binding NarL/FixJ family response regulator
MCPVLIVEDNEVFRATLKEVLMRTFPSVVVGEASNSEEAFSEFEKIKPCLILMDIRLPGKNGLEITKKIKEINPKTEVIILTTFDIPEYREAAFRSGASHFLTKGNIKIDDLSCLVASALEAA